MNTEKLYNALINQDLLSISFDDFQNKLQDDSYKSKVHQTIVDQDLYSGDFNTFQKQYITGPGSTPKLEKEISPWQSFKNNIYNAFEMGLGDVGEFYFSDEGAGSSFDIAATLLYEGAFGKEKIKEWQQTDFGKWFFSGYEGTDSKEFTKSMEAFEEEKKESRRTMTFKEADSFADYLSVASGAIANVGGSVSYNLLTGGTGFFMQFASENFITANEEKAKANNTTVDNLLKSGNYDVKAPMQIAAFQAGLEYFGVSKILGRTGIGRKLNKKVGELLTKNYKKQKNIRTGLNILGTGRTEAFTEMGQTGLEIYNKELAVAKGKGEDINDLMSIVNGMFSPEGIEAGLQGFFGGSGLKGGAYSAKALNNIRKNDASLDVENDLSNLVDLRKRYNSSKDEDVRFALDKEIKKAESNIRDKIKKGNDIYNSLSDGDIKKIEELSDLSDVTAFRANNLIEKFKDGIISENDFNVAIEGLSNQYKENKQGILEIIYKENIEFAKTEAEKIGKEVIEIESLEDFQKRYEEVRTEGDFEGDVTDRDGFIKGDQIFINKQTALKEGAISVGSHELLHGVIGNYIDNLSSKDRIKLGKDFMSFLNSKQKNAVLKRLKDSYNLEGDAVYNKTGVNEMFTALSDAAAKKEVTFDKTIGQKLKQVIQELIQKVFPGDIDYKKEFSSGRQAFDFLAEYNKNIKEGKLGERVLTFAKGKEAPITKDKSDFSKTATTEQELAGDKSFETEIQESYEKGDLDAIQEAYKPRIKRVLRAEWGWTEENKDKFDAIVEEAVGPDRGILQLILGPGKTKYDPTLGVPLSGHIGSVLQKRGLREFVKREYPEGVIEQQMGKESVAKEVAKIETQPQDVILTKKVLDQYKTPLLSGFTFVKEQIKTLRDTVSKIVGGYLPDLNATISKNKSVSPLIADMKAQLYVKNGPIHKMVYDLMTTEVEALTQEYLKKTNPKTKKLYTLKDAKNQAFKDSVEAFFKNTKYKKAILDSLTTTWLAKHLPAGVQKKVVGIGWVNHDVWKGRKKGAKKGNIEAWQASEEGPYKGMTDGKQKIRRNPKIMTDVSPAMLLSAFV